jgi:hypothetical protein
MSAPSNQALIKSGNLNSFLLGGSGTQLNAAQAPANLALNQQQLGLQQYNAQTNNQNQQLQMQLQQQQMQNQIAQQNIDNYMKMLAMSGGTTGGSSPGSTGIFGSSSSTYRQPGSGTSMG